MLPSHPPTFFVNHGGVHARCKDTLKISDLMITSYESLNFIAEPIQICSPRKEDLTATTIDVWMHVSLSVKELFYEVPIEEFL